MTFYNTTTQREITTLPTLDGIANASWQAHEWLYRRKGIVPVHPDPEHRPIPDGMEIAPDGRDRISREDGDMQEHLTLITHAEGQAIRDAELAAMPPGPSVVVVDIDSETSEPSGKTYRALTVDGVLTSTLNSASPQRPGAEQIAEAVRKRKAQVAAIGEFGKGQLQRRIEALEAWVLAQESGEGRT